MKLKTTIATLLIVSLLTSCKKEDSIPLIPVPQYLKQMIPYTNGEVVRFRKTSATLVEATVTVTQHIATISSCQSCDDKRRIESITYEFKQGNREFARMSIDNRPNVFLSIMSPVDNFQSGSGFDFLTENGIPEPLCNGPRQACLDSVTLQGVTHYDVLELRNGEDPDRLTRAYYTIEKGIVGFKYGNGQEYVLVE